MKRDQVTAILQHHQQELVEQYSVQALALFGSTARDRASATSDVDLVVEFSKPVGYFHLFALQDYLTQLLGCPVDLGTLNSLKPRIRRQVEHELVHVI
ncbi:MAG: nucleotidyltransferase family protein [Caldilineales bacterium]|nr:nucleotidyltransferase family protein [Caldilineales bacterium]